MSQPKSKVTEWAHLLQNELKATEKRPIGNDWYTVNELREKHGTGEKKMYQLIRKLMTEKRCERFRGYIISESGATVYQVWYRLIPCRNSR